MRIAITLVLTALMTVLYGQNGCSTYFPFQEGMTLEYSYYNKKDKLEATSIQTIENVQEKGGETMADVQTRMTDAKGKETIEGSFTVTCSDGTFRMDMSRMLPAESMAALGGDDAEVTMEGDGFQLPTNLDVGQTLPDSENTISLQAGIVNMNMTMIFRDQQVEAKETVTTPAGTFDCIRFSYTTYTKMTMVKNEIRTVNWYAEGVGTVKSETYNKKGKLDSKMVLTQYSK